MLLVSLASNNLSNYGRRHFKLFTNCHVSWDTLYQGHKVCIKNIFKHNIHVALLYCKQNVQTFNYVFAKKQKGHFFSQRNECLTQTSDFLIPISVLHNFVD